MSAGVHRLGSPDGGLEFGDARQGGVLLRAGSRVRVREHRRRAVGRLAGAGRRDGSIGVAGAERRAEGCVDGVDADLVEFSDRGVDVVFAGRDQFVPARVGVDVEPAGGDDDAEPGRREPGIDPAGDLPPGDLPVPAESAGADRDADPAALEVQVLGRARIRKAFPSPASASVGGCFPGGEEAGQLLAGHVVQGDREVAVRGRGLRWLGVIVVSRPGVRGTGGGPGVLPARSGRAGRGRVWRRGGWLVFFRAGARVRTVRVRVVLPGGSGGSGGWLCWGRRRGDRAGPADGPLPAGRLPSLPDVRRGGGRTGRCWSRRAGRRGAGAVLGWRAVLRRVVEQGLLDRARVTVDVAGVVQLGGRGRRRGLDRGPGGVDGLGPPLDGLLVLLLAGSGEAGVRVDCGGKHAAEDGAAGAGGGEQPVTQAAGDTRLYPRGDFLPPDEGRGAVIAAAVGDQPVRGCAVPALAGAVVTARDRPAGLVADPGAHRGRDRPGRGPSPAGRTRSIAGSWP